MPILDCEISDFDPAIYPGLNETRNISISWPELIHAAIMDYTGLYRIIQDTQRY